MRLSDQALGTIMMCLQKAIMEESDVTDHLRTLNFIVAEDEKLEVLNPPTFEIRPSFQKSNATTGSD